MMNLYDVKVGGLLVHRETGVTVRVTDKRNGPFGILMVMLEGESGWFFPTDQTFRRTYTKKAKATAASPRQRLAVESTHQMAA